MPQQPDPLRRVSRAARYKRAAELEYLAALRAAREAGASYAEIARAAGATRQSVRQTLTR